MKLCRVYILTNASRSTLYTGITSTLPPLGPQALRPLWLHRQVQRESLVYFETFLRVGDAIAREKQIKGWRRSKKVALIASMNPRWDDLSREWPDVYKPDET